MKDNETSNDLFKSLYEKKAQSIIKLKNKKIEGNKIFEKLELKESNFLDSVPHPHGKFLLYGLLCFAAIIFDYVITLRTIVIFDEFLHPIILAFILSFIDLGIATLQAGTFATSIAGKKIAKKRWRPVLWSMGVIKILLFIILVFFVSPDEFELSTNWLLFIIELLLLILVYIILDFAGEGIYFIFNKIKFWFLKEIWHEDKEPNKVERRLNETYQKLNLEINQNGHSQEEVYKFFSLN